MTNALAEGTTRLESVSSIAQRLQISLDWIAHFTSSFSAEQSVTDQNIEGTRTGRTMLMTHTDHLHHWLVKNDIWKSRKFGINEVTPTSQTVKAAAGLSQTDAVMVCLDQLTSGHPNIWITEIKMTNHLLWQTWKCVCVSVRACVCAGAYRPLSFYPSTANEPAGGASTEWPWERLALLLRPPKHITSVTS